MAVPAAGSGSATAPRRTRRRVEDEDAEGSEPIGPSLQREALIQLLKSELKTAQETRDLKSAVMANVMLDAESAPVTQSLAATKKYAEISKGVPAGPAADRKRKALRQPHAHLWEALVSTVLGVAKEKKYSQIIKAIENHVTELKGIQGDVDKYECLQSMVTCARVNKAFHKEIQRLDICITKGTSAEKAWIVILYVIQTEFKGDVRQ
eukprot:TRINITY_DN24451_c0_g3_i1.p2 TRINITY_DN24451_c0_g3~~TRINITY_DN24451_c0_g3_i1.p2  ORF type:complete len:208 (+),score=57.74 TRINITY_DN24451_c0_g3_i1:126-749(+)